MLSLRGLWNRHRRKLFFALGALGGGYAIYKFYDAHRRRVTLLERQLEGVRDVDELIKSQLQNHFENIQRISDTTTLPYAMHYLKSRIAADLDVSYLTEKLRQAKGQYSTLTTKDKAELWERLKILSFTRLTTSSMTVICLYVKVLVNILGRHLYVDIARGSKARETSKYFQCLLDGRLLYLTSRTHSANCVFFCAYVAIRYRIIKSCLILGVPCLYLLQFCTQMCLGLFR